MLYSLFKLIYLTFGLQTLLPQTCDGSHSSIYLEDNGYKGVVIAISPEITDTSILDKTQTLLRIASQKLFDATADKLSFKQITIILPNTKTWTAYSANDDQVPSTRYGDADIIIRESEKSSSNIDEEPDHSFTKQFGGCGEHALPIVLTKELVLDTDSNKFGDINAIAKLLVHEWAHYRYGVFNEFGFPSDPIYPLYYSIAGNTDSEEILVNSCTDDQQSFNIKTKTEDGGNCTMATSKVTGMPLPANERCIPLPDPDNNPTIQSSLMYSQSLKNVTKFCGSTSGLLLHKHNLNSPNKQNNLCDGKDIWSVINAHADLNGVKSSKINDPGEITFNLWKDTNPRVLFGLHNSKIINFDQKRLINAIVKEFCVVNVPEADTAFFIYNSGTDIKPLKPLWGIAKDNYNNYKLGEPSDPAKPIDFESILAKAVEIYKLKRGGIFMLLVGGTELVNTNSDKIINIAKNLRQLNVKLNIIDLTSIDHIDKRIQAINLFKAAVSITGGQVFNIRKNILTAANISTFSQIRKAFRTVLTDYSGSYTKSYHIIKEQVFSLSNLKAIDEKDIKTVFKINLNFKTDSSLIGSELKVYFIQSRSNEGTGGFLDLSSARIDYPKPQTNNFNGVAGDTYIYEYSVIMEDRHIGDWQASIEVKKEDLKPEDSVTAIAEFSTKSIDKKTATAECWLNTDVLYEPITDKPIIVYVNLNQGFNGLISEAIVKVNVIHEKSNNSQTIELLDNGSGDPDITKGDGIYSQYIYDFKSLIGFFTINAIITDTNGKVLVRKNFGSTSLPIDSSAKACCGSRIEGQSEELKDIERTADCGSIFVSKPLDINNYPPNPVRDVQIESVTNRTVSLVWTAPTLVKVDKYEIKAFSGSDSDSSLRSNIKNNFESTNGEDIEITFDTTKDNSGTEQRCDIKIISKTSGMYYFALKASNTIGIKSVVSNIAMAHIKSNVEIKSTTAFAIDVSKELLDDTDSNHSWWLTPSGGLQWYTILIICVGTALILVFIIIIVICCIAKRRRKNVDSEQPQQQIPQRRAPEPPEVEKSPSILADNISLAQSVDKIPNLSINGIQSNNSYNSGSQQNLRELNVNALSPVQSWDAKDLLSHWGRVQEAKQRHEAPPVMRIEDLESTSSNHSQSYASSEDDNTAIYTNPNTWYQDMTARTAYLPNGYNEPIYRSSLDPLRSNTPSDTVPRYSTITRKPTQNVSQV